MSIGRYVLVGQTPVEEPDLMKWAAAFEDQESRVVRQEEVGALFVSTVFLGLDHSFGGEPLLFETMIFRSGLTEEYCERCGTWMEAEAQHREAVDWAKSHQ